LRLDKWLWAARFFKTRGLAQQAIESGRVTLNAQRVKCSHALKPSDAVVVRVGDHLPLVIPHADDDGVRRGGLPVAGDRKGPV